MKKIKQQLTRTDKKALKQCLQKYPSSEPLYLLFQLSSHLPEIEEISYSTDFQSNNLFKLYSVENEHFLSVHEDIESFDHQSPSEFKQITRLINKNCKNNPQSIGIVIDARYLRIAESNELFILGQNVRSRVDTIRNGIARNLPIILIVRNMEDIDGFESWTQHLAESRLDEAFGFAIPDEEIEAQSFISAAFRSINNKLVQPDQSSETASQQLFQSFLSIKKNLIALTNGLVQTKPDLVPPKFMGLYFMGMVNHPVSQSDEPDDNPVFMRKPAFVKEVCHFIFSQAATYSSYFQPESRHRFFFKTMTLSIVVCLLMAMGGLYMVYQSHKQTFQNTYSSIAMLQKNITTPQDAIGYFHAISHHIEFLDQTVADFWIPWFGFSSQNDPLNDVKQNYVTTFRKYLFKPLVDQFLEQMRTHLGKRSAVKDNDQEFHQKSGQFVGTLVFYIEFMNQFMGTRQKENFVFQPNVYKDGKGVFEHPISKDRFNLFMTCYTNALTWANNRRPFRKDLNLFKTSIEEMVALMPNVMEWTYPIVNSQHPDIDLMKLWIQDLQVENPDTTIKAAYSKKGYEYIQKLFQVIRMAHTIPSKFDARSQTFYKNYEDNFFNEWSQAVNKFENISNYLETRELWADIVFHLHDIQKNPYFQMIDLIVAQTQPFIQHKKKWPQWLQLCHRLHDESILASMNTIPKPSSETTNLSEIANVFNGYLNALKKIDQLPNTPEVSYQIIKTLFVNSGTFCPGDGPDTIACLSIFQLQSIWSKKDQDNEAFWKLYEGPIHFIRKFSLRETACQLQQNWEETVLSVDSQVGKGSLVKKQKKNSDTFIKTNAHPFLEKNFGTSYVPKQLSGLVVPFRESFFKYIAYHPRPQEALKDRYPITIKATPSRTNKEATSQPQLTLIKMKCNQNQQIMVIGHQPVQETFYWSESCGPVHVTFHLKDMKLTRSYTNPMAFPKFIRDVQYGSKRFHRSEFVLDKVRLKSMNIEYVELKLKLFGHESIAKAQERGFLTAPEKITYCWEKSKNQQDGETAEKSEKAEKKIVSKKPEKKQPIQKKQKTEQLHEAQTKSIEKPDIQADAYLYMVILASFRTDINAVKKAKRFSQNGLTTEVYWLKDKNNNPWYILVSGMYASYSQAMKSVDEIKTTHNIMPFIKKMKKKTIEERKVNSDF